MGPLDEIFRSQASEIHGRTEQGMMVLAKLITLGGLSMSLVNSTAPMSGYEHVMSHVLDMQAEGKGLALAKHGSQVALATLLCSVAYQEFLDYFAPAALDLDSCFPPLEPAQTLILETFKVVDPSGKMGDECWSEYRQKLERWSSQREKLAAFVRDWEQNQRELRSYTRPAGMLFEILQAIGAPLSFKELEPHFTDEEVRYAFMNGPLMRKRLNLGDMLIFTGWDRDALWQKIRTAAPGL